MDILQLQGDYFENEIASFSAKQSDIWTALPGIIVSYNPVQMTCSVQPAIQGKLFTDAGETNQNMPLLVDCPVHFVQGGGVTFTFPVSKGDECLIIFSSRTIDGWWYNGAQDSNGNAQPKPQLDDRMHDLSDGFVLVGVRSQPRVLTNVSSTTAQIRSDDGQTIIELNPGNHTVNINSGVNGSVNITSPMTTINGDTTINGNLHVTGTVTGDVDVIGGGKSLKSHTHSGVTPGSGSSGGPN